MRAAAQPAGSVIARPRIDARFNGPPESANGGYACGVVARHIDGPATVTLRMPPPLERELEVVADENGAVRLLDGEALVAEGRPTDVPAVEPPVRVTFADALDARTRHPAFGERHLLSDCFVCGPGRTDGLGASPGPLLSDPEVGAAPFAPGADLADDDGRVPGEIVWAGLDCPSYAPKLWRERRLCLLGRLTAARHREIAIGERLAAVGWMVGVSGRKYETASVLLDDDGAIVARAQATWIELRT